MRVNVDSSVASDPRFIRLGRYLAIKRRDAIGGTLCVWMVCYERRSPFLSAEDLDIAAEQEGFALAMVRAQLADECPEGIRVRGVDDRIGFLFDQADRASAGGRAKAELDRAARIALATANGAPMATPNGTGMLPTSPNGAERHSERHATAIARHAAPDLAPDLSPAPDLALSPAPALKDVPASPVAPVAIEQSRQPSQEAPARQPALPALEAPPEVATGQPAALPAKKRPRAVADSDWHRAIHVFDQLFRGWSGQAPKWGGRERGQLKQLLEAGVTPDEVAERANRMFDMAGKFPAEHPDMGTLLANWDKFVEPPVATSGAPRVGQGRVATAAELGPSGDRRF